MVTHSTPSRNAQLLRTNPGGLQIEFYVQGWFAIRDLVKAEKLTPDTEMYGDHFRELVVSSVATAINHGDTKSKNCGGRMAPTACNIDTLETTGGANNVLRDLNIRKVGFQSHR